MSPNQQNAVEAMQILTENTSRRPPLGPQSLRFQWKR